MVHLLLAYAIRYATKQNCASPDSLSALPGWGTFRDMRRAIDVAIGRQKYRLFQQGRAFDGGPAEYAFLPREDVTYCFLFRPEDVDRVMAALQDTRA